MIKSFHNYQKSKTDKPKIGDYIIYGNDYESPKTDFHNYLKDNIGKLFDISEDGNIIVEYDNKPKDKKVLIGFYDGKTGLRFTDNVKLPTNKKLNPHKYYIYISYIIKYWAKTKKDLEILITSKKYNL